MGEKPFCTIDIPNIETAVWLRALLNPNDSWWMERKADRIFEAINDVIPGGMDALLDRLKDSRGTHAVFGLLDGALEATGIPTRGDTAPWLKPTAPHKIDGNTVAYSASGVKFGCQSLSLDEMREMVKRCEKQS